MVAKEIWSRSVSVTWSPPYSGNSPVSLYKIRYWRQISAPHRLNEISVSSSQTSALIKELQPGTLYELTVVAENEVGKGFPGDTLSFKTREEEPSGAPIDISVEPKGTSTVKVSWKAPPEDEWNGQLLGFYVGYKVRGSEQQYSYQSVEAKKFKKEEKEKSLLSTYEYFVPSLLKNTEYNIIVKTYNSAGTGPASHELWVRTLDGNLPPAPRLFVISSSNSITLRWSNKEMDSSSITGYTIHYTVDGENKWREVQVPYILSTPSTDFGSNGITGNSFVLKNIEPGVSYTLYITSVNAYGMGDPSNVVTTTVENGTKSLVMIFKK